MAMSRESGRRYALYIRDAVMDHNAEVSAARERHDERERYVRDTYHPKVQDQMPMENDEALRAATEAADRKLKANVEMWAGELDGWLAEVAGRPMPSGVAETLAAASRRKLSSAEYAALSRSCRGSYQATQALRQIARDQGLDVIVGDVDAAPTFEGLSKSLGRLKGYALRRTGAGGEFRDVDRTLTSAFGTQFFRDMSADTTAGYAESLAEAAGQFGDAYAD